MFFRTVGCGAMHDTNAAILKVATTSSLVVLAPMIADLLMLHLYRHRKRYRARKFDESPDFSSYVKKIDERRKYKREHPEATDEQAERALKKREDDFRRRLEESEDVED